MQRGNIDGTDWNNIQSSTLFFFCGEHLGVHNVRYIIIFHVILGLNYAELYWKELGNLGRKKMEEGWLVG